MTEPNQSQRTEDGDIKLSIVALVSVAECLSEVDAVLAVLSD